MWPGVLPYIQIFMFERQCSDHDTSVPEHNIKTVEALASISLAELQKIPGFSDIRARTVKKAASDCLQVKAAKPLTTAVSSVPTTVKKTTTKKIVASPAVSQVEADKVKDKKKKKKDD